MMANLNLKINSSAQRGAFCKLMVIGSIPAKVGRFSPSDKDDLTVPRVQGDGSKAVTSCTQQAFNHFGP